LSWPCLFSRQPEFEFEVEQEISAEDREWLEEHAVDQVTVESEGEHQLRQKFEFSVRPRDEKPVALLPLPGLALGNRSGAGFSPCQPPAPFSP
jgi:hypothetical protein